MSSFDVPDERTAAWSFPTAWTIPRRAAPIALLGVPFDNVTTEEAVALVESMIALRRPHYLATANVDFLVQALRDVELRRILFEAHLVLCDGTPLLWASRWLGNPLAERVAGSDLVPLLVKIAAQKGYRLYFLGGRPEATGDAVRRLRQEHPAVVIAGHYSPPYQELLAMDHADVRRRIQAAAPDLLFVCFGCPKQEKWIAMHYRNLNVPVCVGVGGTVDFLAGRLPRAPKWMQRTGTEWLFRLAQEPRRLFKRYTRDGWYFGWAIAGQWWRTRRFARERPVRPANSQRSPASEGQEIVLPEWLDAETVQRQGRSWERSLDPERPVFLNLAGVQFIDSTGVGILVRLRKLAALQHQSAVLVAPSRPVEQLLRSMHLWPFFLTAPDLPRAKALLEELAAAEPAARPPGPWTPHALLNWRGEVTAANSEQVWRQTEAFLNQRPIPRELTIGLSAVTFMDSTGVDLMIRAKKHALRQGSKLSFTGVQKGVHSVIRLSKSERHLLRR